MKVLIPSLVFRYEFSNAGEDPVEYDPFYQLVKPVNFYIRAKRRTEWPEPTPKPVPESKLETTSDSTPQSTQNSKVESIAEPVAELGTGSVTAGPLVPPKRDSASIVPVVVVEAEEAPTVIANGRS